MATKADVLRFLSGGIGALAGPAGGDGMELQSGTANSPPQRPEVTAPEPQLKDREPFIQGVSQSQILLGTAVLVALIGAVAFIRR